MSFLLSEPSQCPTFEHRPEEDFPPLPAVTHIPPRPVKSQPKLKPTAKGSRSQSKKLLIVTDENLDGNGRYGSSSVSSRQKKGRKGGKA
jgi:hypothetical protein